MILLHRVKGEPFYLNADLIESVEAVPDTVVTTVDGRRVLVGEAPEVVASRIVDFRAAIIVASERLRSAPAPKGGGLVLLPGAEE